jgi:hypothetical protein
LLAPPAADEVLVDDAAPEPHFLGPGAAAPGRPRQAAVQVLGPTSENISPLKIYPAERFAAAKVRSKHPLTE